MVTESIPFHDDHISILSRINRLLDRGILTGHFQDARPGRARLNNEDKNGQYATHSGWLDDFAMTAPPAYALL